MDDSYVSNIFNKAVYNLYSNTILNSNSNFSNPQSYLSVLNNFRADFDDFSFFLDTNLNYNNTRLTMDAIDTESITSSSDQTLVNPTRLSNPLALRSTAKNSITTYGALQKVFKSRFEEGRSNTRITNFADVRSKLPFMTDKRVAYEKLLGKNKESFYNSSFFTNNTFKVFNNFSSATTSLNFYFFDFPFLVGVLSDPAIGV